MDGPSKMVPLATRTTKWLVTEKGNSIFSQVCDEPHPLLIKDMLQHCVNGQLEEAYKVMAYLWGLGYAAEDIITIVFRVCKNHPMAEFVKLEFIKVGVFAILCVQYTVSHESFM